MFKNDVYKMLVDYDEGNYRDIDFVGATWQGVIAFLKHVLASYSCFEKSVFFPSPDEVITVPRESLISELEKLEDSVEVDVNIRAADDKAIIRRLQIEIEFSKGANKISWCELTFFPEDLNLQPGEIQTFIELVEEWKRLFQANMFYVRYGNESWNFDDVSAESGVIFTSDTELT